MKVGDKQDAALTLKNGMRVRGVGMVTTASEEDEDVYELTIPCMHINIQGDKLVESIESKSIRGIIGSSSLHVEKPLMQLAD